MQIANRIDTKQVNADEEETGRIRYVDQAAVGRQTERQSIQLEESRVL